MPVLQSEGPEDTALILWLIGTQEAVARTACWVRPGRRPKATHRRQLYILQGLPGVGPALAKRLLQHFGSVEAVFSAPREKLTEVKGIGTVLSERMRDVISAAWVELDTDGANGSEREDDGSEMPGQ